MIALKSSGMVAGALVIAMGLSGCVTHKELNQTVADSEARTNAALAEHAAKIAAQEVRLNQIDQTARDALARAIAAGKLAEGKFVYSVVLSDDATKFTSGKTVLSTEAKARLTEVANRLKTDNQNVYLEIQGHTDATGSDARNNEVGQARADAVRNFLGKQGVPLSRMATTSYGESAPVASNKTKAGRSANRRVVIVVLK